MNKLYDAAERAIKQSLRMKKGEKFLLVTDKQKLEIAEALAFAAREVGAETTTYLMTETLRPIVEPTEMFRDMIRKADVTAYLLEGRIAEKPFRGFMVAEGHKTGRILMMPGLTRDMMERLVNIDYREMDAFTKRVIRAMQDADDVEITNAAGTRIAFSVKGRKWDNDNGDLHKPKDHGNLPAGECYTAPVESTFTGKLVIGLIDDKLGRGVMEFDRGTLVKWSGKGISDIVKTIGSDRTGMVVGEFGIGTNKGARICANMLEAEKAFGTVHFAIGDSYGIGKNKSKFHYDALVEKVTIKAKGQVVARNGAFMI